MIVDSFIHFTVFLVFLIFSVYLFLKRAEFPQTTVYTLLFFSFSVWSFGFVFFRLESVSESTLSIVVHISSIASICYGVLVFLSIGKFTGWITPKKWIIAVFILYIAAGSFLQFNGYLFNLGEYNKEGYWEMVIGNDWLVLTISNIHNALVIAGFIILFIFFRRTSSQMRKKQSKIRLITGAVSYVLSLSIVHLSQYYPFFKKIYYPDLTLLVFMFGIIYSVFRLEIFEITPSTLAGKIVKMMPSGLVLTDRNLKIVSLNKQFSTITKLKNEAIIDKSLKELFPELVNKTLDEEKNSFTEKYRLTSGSVVLWKFKKICRDNVLLGTISTVTDISKEEATENELKRLNQTLEQRVQERTALLEQREKYLIAINRANILLLKKGSIDYEKYVTEIGTAAKADRTYIFLNHEDASGDLYTTQVAEYSSEGISPQINNPELQNLAYKDFSLRWLNTLSAGNFISGKISEFPENEQKVLVPQQIKAILVLPLITDNHFVGFIGFDNCRSERNWEMHEINLLKVSAHNLAQALTLRKKNELLRKSELKYRQIIEQSIDSIFLYVNDRFVMTNPSFQKTFGFTLDDLNSSELNCLQIVKPVSVIKKLKRFLNDGEIFSSETKEFEVITKNGHTVSCEANFSMMKEKNTKSIQGTIRDVTKRKHKELIIRQLSTAINQSPVSVVITDTNGNIEYVNPKFEDLTGYNFAEVYNRNPRVLKSEKMPDSVYSELWKTISRGNIWKGEFINRKKDGTLYYESSVISPVKTESGHITHFLAIKEDITERKETERKLNNSYEQLKRLAAHLQNIREEERRIISRELHDNLGQSLTALRMYLFRLKKKTSLPENRVNLKEVNKSNNDIIEYVDTIITSVKQLAGNIRPLILEEIGLVSAVRQQLENFSENTGIPSTFSTDTESVSLNISHSTGVYRIVQEALTNIARHAGATKVTISINKKEHAYIIKISDNGRGIDQQQLTNNNTLGILGMHERAYIFDGKLKIEGFKNKGTVVELEIPVK
ncbi:MAG: PAS domain S-box protein [bacterium]